ncbi:MAG: regulatory protein [Halanaerobium sp. 4-GBenrich]|jgi:regulatory protein|uniref:Regulatory protein RecX n=1 Tax=Halanaerobium congolense TaxID=54121 RepID=A0A1M7GM84_9FIRM|nr:regulatory protein RecX [Halanaerobium congolense]ODS50046.1 MAG: regulatory protein [Halanaerobium sp. 4-GBenrich]OEG63654.1 MAG: RecX family transcriptional regulator [Halanaerobium sp. MDAL1]PTX17160.1 regulatory protein [Halanaerobium congolense]PXV69375.1 regulatory protein [Halanaerobium congolense]TDX46853.1 regulatory protein [Halanaerobium congolense]
MDQIDKEKFSQARNKAFKLLSYRERTIKEIEDRLRKKDFEEEIIKAVVDFLLEKDYLNEERFAEMWIRSRKKHHPRGRKLIYKELKNKGLNQRIINNALNQYLSNQEELEMAEYLKDKWLRRRTEEDSSSYKLKNYLANKGFSYDLIYQVTDK